MTLAVAIMIVDDEPDLLYVLKQQLSVWYKVNAFTDPYDAIRFAKSNLIRHDIILSDIKMPGMDGFEFSRFMKREFPQSKIILMTAYALIREEFEHNKLDIPVDEIL